MARPLKGPGPKTMEGLAKFGAGASPAPLRNLMHCSMPSKPAGLGDWGLSHFFSAEARRVSNSSQTDEATSGLPSDEAPSSIQGKKSPTTPWGHWHVRLFPPTPPANQVIYEPRVARMRRGELAGAPQARAYPSPELRGCLGRNWLNHLRSAHPWAQSCENVSGDTG